MTQNQHVRYTDYTPHRFSFALEAELALVSRGGIRQWVHARGGQRSLSISSRLLLVALKTQEIWRSLPVEKRPDFITYLVHSVWAWRDKRVSDYLAYRELRRIFPRPASLHLQAPSKDWRATEAFEPPRRVRFKKVEPLHFS